MSIRDKWVRRFSVDETAKHQNGFTIYKITSVLFPLKSPEVVTVISVWKRYSDIQTLHRSMKSLHAGLHLKGAFPVLLKSSYFNRFQQEVIEERAKSIKSLLEFIAEHRLLFTSTDFVNFLQEGYPEPDSASGIINTIRSSLHLPIEDTPPLEYQTSDDESKSLSVRSAQETPNVLMEPDSDTDLDISQIPIYVGAEIEIRESPDNTLSDKSTSSFESINSLDSIDSDLYNELSKLDVDSKSCVKRNLPDLINFDLPSTSNDMRTSMDDSTSLTSTVYSETDGCSSVRSRSNMGCKTRTDDSYVFEAGYMLNLAARCEDMGDYGRAFECYKSGIEKMLIGVQSPRPDKRTKSVGLLILDGGGGDGGSYILPYIKGGLCPAVGESGRMMMFLVDKFRMLAVYLSGLAAQSPSNMDFLHLCAYVQDRENGVADTDQQRRALIKEKTTKYLTYAETIYKEHLTNAEQALLSEPEMSRQHWSLPLSMLQRPYEHLASYRVLEVLGAGTMLVMNEGDHKYYAMKVIQKIPRNLTEFDSYFPPRTDGTRQPVLPTVIPYMVPLHAYVHTNNLIFLILAYAAGEKLTDYIKNYVKSCPTTPAREVNLENVFPTKRSDALNNIDLEIDTKNDTNVDMNKNQTRVDEDVSVTELVINSQRLLLNVDKALNEVRALEGGAQAAASQDGDKRDGAGAEQKSNVQVNPRDVLPPSAVRRWGAQILTALESLHNCGVYCSDLNPNNILLGSRGQVMLTYFLSYPDAEVTLAQLFRKWGGRSVHVAPELYGPGGAPDKLSDYWSYGVIMYELICGTPPSLNDVYWSHSELPLPEQLPLEERSLLIQLLTHTPSERLGAGPDGLEEIKRHPYFRGVHWQSVYGDWSLPD